MTAAQAGVQASLQSAWHSVLPTELRSVTYGAVREAPAPAVRVAVALSGGNDSMALLDAVASAAARHANISLSAVHVHHGLSRYADEWVAFCERECTDRNIAIDVRRVHVERSGGIGIEAAARNARYAIFRSLDADALLLAHHRDDQAETVLLQLLSGAGPHGLAAMSALRAGRPALMRPFLMLERRTLEAYNRARGVRSIVDESNADATFARNFLRTRIAPILAEQFPAYASTLERAARHQADAAELLDDLARLDAAQDGDVHELAQATLARLPPARARNLLRWFLRQQGLRAPSTVRLESMLQQLIDAAPDASIRLQHDGAEIGRHRGRVKVHAPTSPSFEQHWDGQRELQLPGGTLSFVAGIGEGLAARAVADAGVVVRSRLGGESIRLRADGPRQELKKLFQAAGVPAWEREARPFLWHRAKLVAVPGIGIAHDYRSGPQDAGWRMEWRRRDRGES